MEADCAGRFLPRLVLGLSSVTLAFPLGEGLGFSSLAFLCRFVVFSSSHLIWLSISSYCCDCFCKNEMLKDRFSAADAGRLLSMLESAIARRRMLVWQKIRHGPVSSIILLHSFTRPSAFPFMYLQKFTTCSLRYKMYDVRMYVCTLTEEGVLPSPVKVRGKAHFVSGVLSTMVVFWVGSGDGSETSGADARQPGAPHSLRDGG